MVAAGACAGADCWEPDQSTLDDVINRWVTVQATIAADSTELRVPRMLPADLPAAVDQLLDGEVGARLSPEELEQSRALRGFLPAIIEELQTSGLPDTLVHGNFHPGNWRSDGTSRMIVDWADSYIGHPAADIQRLSGWLPEQQREQVVQAPAAAWRQHLPGSEPLRARAPITVIGCLLSAVTYQRFLDRIEPSERVYHQDDPAQEVRAALLAATRLSRTTG